MSSRKPNILITGTPGVGKTCISTKVAKRLGLQHINISKLAIQKKLTLERDEERDCDIIDERRVRKHLKKKLLAGGCLVEYHSCGFLPKEWFDKVFVLRAETSQLYDRLKERNYKESKVTENIECEIFQVSLEEAYETFGTKLVKELQNNNKTELRKNIKVITNCIKKLNSETTSSGDDTSQHS